MSRRRDSQAGYQNLSPQPGDGLGELRFFFGGLGEGGGGGLQGGLDFGLGLLGLGQLGLDGGDFVPELPTLLWITAGPRAKQTCKLIIHICSKGVPISFDCWFVCLSEKHINKLFLNFGQFVGPISGFLALRTSKLCT